MNDTKQHLNNTAPKWFAILAMVMPTMVIVIALYLVWLANHAKAKGWLA